MSKLLTNQIANYNDNGPVEAKEGLNFPNNKPLQVSGSSGANGQYLKSTGNGLAWQTFPSIPAAQVNADWNAITGIAQILNKPTLSTVATSGSYNDLLNKPVIPAAQVNSDWNATSGLALILNKPTLFSGNYSDLTGKPTIPATIKDLADVQLPNPIPNNTYLKWDQAQLRWVPGTGAAGIADIVQDITPQLGGNLDTNSFDITGGSTSTIELQGQTSKLRFHYDALTDLPSATTWHGMFAHVHSTGRAYVAHGGAWEALAKLTDITVDTNTTYIQEAVAAAGGNVNLRLISSANVQDDILVQAGTNVTIDNISTTGFRINSAAGPTNLDSLTDVTVANPLTGQFLQYTGGGWVNTTVSLGSGGATNLDGLSDVTLTSPANAQYLSYNSTSGQWVNTSLPTANLDALTDVVITTPTSGQALKYNGSVWVNTNDPDTNTTYSQASVASGNNINLRLSGSDSTVDDVLITAGTGITFSSVTANGFTISSSGSGGATNLDGLTDVVISSPANGQIILYNGTSWVNTTPSYLTSTGSIDSHTDVTISSPTSGQVLSYNGSQWVNSAPTGSGGSGLTSRTTANATTASLANDAAGNITITAAKTYALLKIQTSHAAWVTLYTDSASRTADASRTQNTDPVPGSGVLAEVVTTGAQTILMTPTVYGFNNDTTPASSVYLKVVNKSGSAASITVTLTYVQLEV